MTRFSVHCDPIVEQNDFISQQRAQQVGEPSRIADGRPQRRNTVRVVVDIEDQGDVLAENLHF